MPTNRGCVSGNPSGPTLANVFLFTIEKLNDCISKLVQYERFIDNILNFTDSTDFVNKLKL